MMNIHKMETNIAEIDRNLRRAAVVVSQIQIAAHSQPRRLVDRAADSSIEAAAVRTIRYWQQIRRRAWGPQ